MSDRVAIVTGGSRGIGARSPSGSPPTGSDQPHPRQGPPRPRHHRQRGRARSTATALFLGGKDAETIDRMARMNPINRPGTPEDIAEAVSFLAGPGRWVNGRTFYVNGGVA